MKKTDEWLNRYIDVLLDGLEGVTINETHHIRGRNCDPAYFSPLEPFFSHADLSGNPYDRGFFGDVTPADVREWDISTLQDGVDEDERFQLTRFRNVSLKEIRGIRIRSPWVGEYSMGWIDKARTYSSFKSLLHWVGGRWVQDNPIRGRATPKTGGTWTEETLGYAGDLTEAAQIMLGVAFTRDYEWVVRIGKPDGMKLQFVTDPAGTREIFRLRELPVLGNRREALRNWIRSHYRRKRETALPSEVRSHLRGQTKFEWCGYECEIIPSAYDMRMNEKLMLAAENERQQHRQWASQRYGAKALTWI